VTLAERMDSGMIRRIQQFTTQQIPVATIGGLEPKSPEPKLHAARPEGRFGKPNGPAKGYGKKPFARRDDGAPPARSPFERGSAARPFDAARPAGFAPRKAGPAAKGGFKPQRPRTAGFSR
jgi:hypothetical protein